MTSRIELHEELCKILGSRNVYFQPPESVKMIYPAIRYKLDGIKTLDADDKPYLLPRAYQLILIEKNPDSPTVDALAKLPMCRLQNQYSAENLNHWVFKLYY